MSDPLTEDELLALVQAPREPITAPPELWPLVAASTIHLRAVRRQVLRSMRGVLLMAALALAAASALVTWRVARWAMTPDAPASAPGGGAGGVHQGHAGHPTTTRRPQDGPPAPPRPPRPIPPQSGPRPPL